MRRHWGRVSAGDQVAGAVRTAAGVRLPCGGRDGGDRVTYRVRDRAMPATVL